MATPKQQPWKAVKADVCATLNIKLVDEFVEYLQFIFVWGHVLPFMQFLFFVNVFFPPARFGRSRVQTLCGNAAYSVQRFRGAQVSFIQVH